MISKDEAIAQYRSILSGFSSWLVLAKSQFLEHLAIFVSWCLRDALWKIERAQQEFFLSTALNDSSIMTHAEDREYLPRKATPAKGVVRIANNGTSQVSLPENTAFSSDAQLDYLIETALSIAAGSHADVEAVQLSYATPLQVAVSGEEIYFQVTFPRSVGANLARFRVWVDQGEGFEEWTYARLFFNCDADALVYDEFFTHAGLRGIRFGNGVFGKIPPLNSTIKVEYWTTAGDTTLIASQTLQPVSDVKDLAGADADLTITTQEALSGGAAAEAVSEMRQNLRYWQRYNEKLVWDDDYAFFLKRNVPALTWVKVWGEGEQEAESGFDVQNINKIFVTGYAPGASGLSTEVLAALAEVAPLNRKFAWVAPTLSDFTVTVTGKVSKSVDLSTAVNGVKAALLAGYGPDSTTRKDTVRISDLYDLLKGTGYFEGGYYQISLAGVTAPTQLKEMVSLDLAGSTFTLTYP